MTKHGDKPIGLTIRLAQSEYDALVRLANDWKLSLSESIRWAIREADERRGKRKRVTG